MTHQIVFEMKGRKKWENMEMDCLVNIFGRVGIESLALDVPFVCKSWYKASLNPLCWQSLNFPIDLSNSRLPDVPIEGLSWICTGGVVNPADSESVVKGAVKRSQRCATRLVIPNYCSNKDIIYALEECPLLKLLSIPYSAIHNNGGFIIPSMINKLKNLEALIMRRFSKELEEIIAQINLHCKNFVFLCVTNAEISSDAAIAIATLLPNINYLVLTRCVLEKSNLVIILNGCKKLKYADVSNCKGFDSDDKEVLKLASHITTFKCRGSRLYDDYDDDYEIGICSRDVDSDYCSD
ncbi:hypothetical protein LguiA_001785 [Lonicera macranthoides]